MQKQTPVKGIYDQDYAATYPQLYIEHWRAKHELNHANLERLLKTLPRHPLYWLDTACGQAWHFSRVNRDIACVGIDLSTAQLAQAARNFPAGLFVLGDMRQLPFAPHSFDLVTNFWAAYCYLDNTGLIGKFLQQCVALLRPGGALYFELLLAEDLANFNRSKYAQATGFRVSARCKDYSRWRYQDNGGDHDMTSPPLAFFTTALHGHFTGIEARHDGRFMVHLLATGKRS